MAKATVDEVTGSIYTATGCNCMAVFFSLFAACSPYFLWASVQFINVGGASFFSTVSTGSYAMSSFTVPTGYYGYYYGQWNSWSDVKSSHQPCSNSSASNHIYHNWSGKYGMCDKVNGTFKTPTEANTLMACVTLAAIFTFAGSCVGGSVKNGGGPNASRAAGALSCLGTIFSMVVFSVYASWAWVKDLRSGHGYMPIFVQPTPNNIILKAVDINLEMSYGPAFGLAIMSFICSLFATLAFFAAAKPLQDELDGGYDNLDKEYGEGDSKFV